MKIIIENAEESTIKTVKASGNSGRVYLPPSWVGREVEVVLLQEDVEVDCVFQYKDFNLPVQFIFEEDSERVLFWNGLDWVEHMSQIQQNESFQDEVQKEYEWFLEEVGELLNDEHTFQWAYDLEKGSSHSFENNITLFKQF